MGFDEEADLWWAAYSVARTSVASKPADSASVRGMTSNASAYFLMAYWDISGVFSPKADIRSISCISVAPAPGTNFASRVIAFTTFTPSSMARSTSSS